MFKILGVTDDTDTCDKCGKTHLKKVVVLESEATGIVRYGVDCASRAIKGNNKASNRKIIERQADVISFAARVNKVKGSEIAAYQVWNSFGYSAIAKAGAVIIELEREPQIKRAIVFKDGSVNYKIIDNT